jgi:hypothetical protein
VFGQAWFQYRFSSMDSDGLPGALYLSSSSPDVWMVEFDLVRIVWEVFGIILHPKIDAAKRSPRFSPHLFVTCGPDSLLISTYQHPPCEVRLATSHFYSILVSAIASLNLRLSPT